MPAHIRRVITPSPRGRGGRFIDARVGRIDAERERGRAVGDQVDPQDLRRQQRQDDPAIAACAADQVASSTPKNIVMTSPMFDDSR